MNHDSTAEPKSFRRYTTLAIWIGAILIGLLIPLQILKLGYIPGDDAMRHVAKALTDKPWTEILVMGDGFMDDHPGWQAILAGLHRGLNWNADNLMFFSVCWLFLAFWFAAFAWRKRPEAMLAVLFLASLLVPGTFTRLLFGRPFIVMMVVYMVLIQLWIRAERISPTRLIASTLLLAFSVWAHGSWYLFALPVMGFALVGQWKKSFSIFGCWMVGTVLGASLTGHPVAYIWQTLHHLINAFGNNTLERMLVTEFRPDPGDVNLLFAAALLLIWRRARGEWKREAVFNPLFAMAVLGWLLGLKVSRFWVDWGFPATLLWMAAELEAVLESRFARGSMQSAGLALAAAFGVYVTTVRDIGNRWTGDLTVEYITPSETNPEANAWLPGKGGIIFAVDMEVFYRTFYKNPNADWRYILGFEPGLMPKEDLEILRKIQWNSFAGPYDAWIKKMRPEDRLIFLQGSDPRIDGLDWYHAARNTWIGRLPGKF